MISTCYARMIELLVFSLWVSAVACQTLSNPVVWQSPRIYNSTTGREYYNDYYAQISTAQDFQTIYTGGDPPKSPRRLLFDYSDCCIASNITTSQLQRLNNNHLNYHPIENASIIAIVQRGNCNWSEKFNLAKSLSVQNGLNLKALFISDNQTRDGVQIQSFSVETVSQRFTYTTPLPDDRNITNMADNDLAEKADLPAYFVPKVFGDDLRNLIVNSTDRTNLVFWQIALYLDASRTFGDGATSSSFSHSYLSYIIALISVFVVAMFAGVIFLRWWRVRRLREQMEYEAQLNAHAYNMQMRMKAKPLPVDLVNALPIALYSPETVKNGNCAICLEDYVEGQSELRILGCGHGFCVLCIDPWLTQKSTKCPICKYDCLPPELRDDNHENDSGAESSSINGEPNSRPPERSASSVNDPEQIVIHSPSNNHDQQPETQHTNPPTPVRSATSSRKENSQPDSSRNER